jgi:hypothetical protein
MPGVEVTKPVKGKDLTVAYQALAKAKQDKDLTAIAAAEESIRTVKSSG